MTIMEAIERAKLIRKAKEQTGVHRQFVRSHDDTADSENQLHLQESVAEVPPREPQVIVALDRVEFDARVSESHHVIVDLEGGKGARADAAYRMLRSRVLNRVRTDKWSCLGVCSPGPGEGKTVTTLNLAICIAREKQRQVYLLDLDMRSPSLLEYVGVQVPVELSRYFTDKLAPEQVLFETNVSGLVIGGNREPVNNASELLATGQLQQLLIHLRRRSPDALIIIDLPPVTSTDEAIVVAPRVDGMLLVVSEGVTRREELRRSIDMLSDFPVLGIVMNRSSEGLGRKYYGAY